MTPWLPFYPRDFLTATLGWTAEERGHYAVLLCAQWEQGGLPDDPKRLELISPGIRSAWKTVSEKFPVWADGRRRNHRLELERSKAMERSERARQSASSRWSSTASGAGDGQSAQPAQSAQPDDPDPCDRICDRISDRICDRTTEGICAGDAAIAICISPPPPGSETPGTGQDWPRLRAAWNAGDGVHRRPWRSSSPPPGAVDRLGEPGWLEEALRAVEHLPRCRRFKTPATLSQFVQAGWVARVLGGEFDDPIRAEPARGGPGRPDDRPPAEGWGPELLERKRLTEARLAAGG
jgi:uncharacterized protein YdaU (DUF1376 family)